MKSNDSLWSQADRLAMTEALQLARQGQFTARPNPMVGCVLVKNNEVIGRGWHQKAGLAHAEINALASVSGKASGATCYVTLEPCAHQGKTGPCAKALIDAGVKKVIAAMEDPNPLVAGKGFQILLDAGVEVEYGLMEQQAQELNKGFVSRFTRKRPWVTCKLAMSIDGRTALASGESQWITGAAARSDVQKLRAKQDAIMTGVGTVLRDNPSLNIRSKDVIPSEELKKSTENWFEVATKIGFKQPARVLFDRHASANIEAKIFNDNAQVYWVTNGAELPEKKNLVLVKARPKLVETMEYLADLGMNNVLLESGHQLAGEFIQQGLIDELIVYMAPKLMGNHGKGLFELNIETMQQNIHLALKDIRQLGDDIRLVYEIKE
ncbi:bifunctional diaminohydroxyphosphoribosylaminopyrimidine deaminase/5-amino-6-(5-phosphoribosylamino)uracil reductase RibD [Aliikangiella sp. IMCC44359]|uniref:bifunctional diaminohydroxyphosphoribosylaminopyrimidine deaminase/5-amino-6-(5-phosphoribosylamino)uracil reductase RibD n=1 Tax=Aliikangiella sp. IMCC44359 TaxID=3459125 RepID=UPI00403A852B